jgi:hypothetical protein
MIMYFIITYASQMIGHIISNFATICISPKNLPLFAVYNLELVPRKASLRSAKNSIHAIIRLRILRQRSYSIFKLSCILVSTVL